MRHSICHCGPWTTCLHAAGTEHLHDDRSRLPMKRPATPPHFTQLLRRTCTWGPPLSPCNVQDRIDWRGKRNPCLFYLGRSLYRDWTASGDACCAAKCAATSTEPRHELVLTSSVINSLWLVESAGFHSACRFDLLWTHTCISILALPRGSPPLAGDSG